MTAIFSNKLYFLFGKQNNRIINHGYYIDLINKTCAHVLTDLSASTFQPVCHAAYLQESSMVWAYAGMCDLDTKEYNNPYILYNIRFVQHDMVQLMDFDLEAECEFKGRMQATLIHQNAKAL